MESTPDLRRASFAASRSDQTGVVQQALVAGGNADEVAVAVIEVVPIKAKKLKRSKTKAGLLALTADKMGTSR